MIELPADGPARLHRLTYPDGPHDAEALLVDAAGRPVVVTKDAGPAGVYRTAARPTASGRRRWCGSAQVALPPSDTAGGPLGGLGSRVVTGAAASADGRVVALRSYTDAWLYRGARTATRWPRSAGPPGAGAAAGRAAGRGDRVRAVRRAGLRLGDPGRARAGRSGPCRARPAAGGRATRSRRPPDTAPAPEQRRTRATPRRPTAADAGRRRGRTPRVAARGRSAPARSVGLLLAVVMTRAWRGARRRCRWSLDAGGDRVRAGAAPRPPGRARSRRRRGWARRPGWPASARCARRGA